MSNTNNQYFDLCRKSLKAASRFMADNDIRYHLNGVMIEVHKDRTFYVATEGHMLGVVTQEVENSGIKEPIKIIIPNRIVKLLTKGSAAQIRRNPVTVIELLENKKIKTFAFDMDVHIEFMPLCSEKFIDWLKVIPNSFSGEQIPINFDYLNKINMAARDLCIRGMISPHITYNGQNAAMVRYEGIDNLLAIVMGMRPSTTLSTLPEWFPKKD